jgi:GT2 family glycosyltransferase
MAQLSTTRREPNAAETRPKEPSVLVVLVVHDGMPWLRECLRSLSRQTHPRLGIVAIDSGSTDGSREALEQALGASRVVDVPAATGLPGAVQAGLRVDAADRADYVLILHDDTALEPEAVAGMVQAAERVEGVGVVGPKVVDWDDPRVLREVGQSTDRFGYPYSPLEEDEIDHGQYDRVREVLFVSSCAMLVSRAALRRAGPPDERLAPFHEDLDFCWRARLAGFRVLMSPRARARHRGASLRGERIDGPRADRVRLYAERASLAAMLKNYGLLSLVWVLPLYAVQAAVKAATWAISRRFDETWQVVGAWGWNLVHLPGTIRRRIRAQAVRSVPDRSVRRYMAPAGVRLRRWVEVAGALLRRRGLESTAQAAVPVDEEEELELPTLGARTVSVARAHPVATAWVLLATLALVAYRHLVGHPPLEGGAIAAFPSGPSGFFAELVSGVRTTGLGGADPASPALGMLGVLSAVLLGSTAIAQKLLLTLLPPLAGIGMYRSVMRRTGERVPALLAAACYGLSAVVLWAFSQGRIPALVLLAAAPSLLDRLDRAFGPRPTGSRVRFVVESGLVLAVAASFFPGAVLAFAVLFLAVLLVPDAGGRVRGIPLAAAVLVTGAVLALPVLIDAAAGPGPGLGSTAGSPDFGALVRLSPGDAPGSWAVGWFLPAAALLSLTVVERLRRRAAVRMTVAAVAGVYLAWLSAAGYLPAALSNPSAYLAVAAVGECVLVGLGVATLLEMGRRSFGYRQLAGVATTALVTGGLVLQALVAGIGGWDVGPRRLPPAWPLAASGSPAGGPYRVLWVGARGGDPFPPPGGDAVATASAGGVTLRYALTGRNGVTALDTGRGSAGPGWRYLERTLDQILTGTTTHGGALLGPLSVGYVVAAADDLPDAAGARLDAQVDLDLVPAGGLVIYRNARVLPEALSTDQAALVSAADGTDLLPIASAPPFDGRRLRPMPGGYRGGAPQGSPRRVLLGQQFDAGWRLSAPGGTAVAPRRAFGWATGFDPPAGRLQVRYGRQWLRDVEVAVLGLLWLAALWITRKPARRAVTAPRTGASP